VLPGTPDAAAIEITSMPTQLQACAFALLDLSPTTGT
jgi:hypothetical protein